jgi:cell division protein FtsW
MNERAQVDGVLLFAILALVSFGVVMVYSASAVSVQAQTGDALFYLKRHLVAVALGLIALVVGMRIGTERLVPMAYPMILASAVLLVLVLIPGIGGRVGGSTRWIRLGMLNFQPGELAKVAFVIYLACSLTRKRDRIRAFSVGFLPHLLVCGVFLLLLLAQPDFGTAAILTLLLFFMLYLAGTRVSYIVVAALAALPMAYGLVVGSEYRMRRLLAFMDPWAHRFDIGYQISESLMSFGSGGVLGAGLGEGKHKLFFLPAAHTDFIYSLVGEELGLIGASAVLLAFGVVVWRGMRAAWRAPNLFATYVAFGLTTLIGLQTLINMGVVTGLLPTKGLTLPFISYGRSSMLCTLFAAGILLAISAQGSEPKTVDDSKVTWP